MSRTHLVAGVVTAVAVATSLAGCTSQSSTAELDYSQILRETTPYQRNVLADKTVTPDEYQAAVMATWDCVKGAGFNPDDPVWTHGQLVFSTAVEAADTAAVDALSAKYDASLNVCESDYLDDIGQVWAFQLLLAPEDRERTRPDVITCLKEHGLETTDDATDDEIFAEMTPENVELWGDCADTYPGYFMSAPEGS